MSKIVAKEFLPFLRIYEDGRIERLVGDDILEPSLDLKTNVQSRDVVYSTESGQSARLYLRKTTNPNHKLPLIIYFHGGAFCVESAFSPLYHPYLNKLVNETNVVAISVDYRRAPEDPLPCAYDDSWDALQWIATHSQGNGVDEWLNRYADFNKVFLIGDSAGANIAHQMTLRLYDQNILDIKGLVLVHPYFSGRILLDNEVNNQWGMDLDKIWRFTCPDTSGLDDPRINPIKDSRFGKLGCNKVMMFVAGKDFLRDRGWLYYEELMKNGWGGKSEILEDKEEGHVFHIFNPDCENGAIMLKRIASFINE